MRRAILTAVTMVAAAAFSASDAEAGCGYGGYGGYGGGYGGYSAGYGGFGGGYSPYYGGGFSNQGYSVGRYTNFYGSSRYTFRPQVRRNPIRYQPTYVPHHHVPGRYRNYRR